MRTRLLEDEQSSNESVFVLPEEGVWGREGDDGGAMRISLRAKHLNSVLWANESIHRL